MSNEKDDAYSLEEWMQANVTIFDRSAAFKEHVMPLIDQLREACEKHCIGMSLITQFGQSETGAQHSKTTRLLSVEEASPGLLMHALQKSPDRDGLDTVLALNYAARERVQRMMDNLKTPAGTTIQ